MVKCPLRRAVVANPPAAERGAESAPLPQQSAVRPDQGARLAERSVGLPEQSARLPDAGRQPSYLDPRIVDVLILLAPLEKKLESLQRVGRPFSDLQRDMHPQELQREIQEHIDNTSVWASDPTPTWYSDDLRQYLILLYALQKQVLEVLGESPHKP